MDQINIHINNINGKRCGITMANTKNKLNHQEIFEFGMNLT